MNYKLTAEKQKIVQKAEALAQEERRITVDLIRCLEEISKQMIYAEMGYSSLHEFCTKYLKLSEGSAGRRVAAMRLNRDVPTVSEKILSGELSLTNAAKIEISTQKVHKSSKNRTTAENRASEKAQIVESCLNLSQRECDYKLFSQLPELADHPSYREKARVLNGEETELKLVLSQDLRAKIEELQNLLSHSNPEKSYLKLLEKLVDQELVKLKKKISPKNTQGEYKGTQSAAEKVSFNRITESTSFARFIPADLRRFVWTRAQNRCQYPGCGSTYQLQIEHRHPVAKGGVTTAENLILLCRTHNLLRAKQEFGEGKMREFAPGRM